MLLIKQIEILQKLKHLQVYAYLEQILTWNVALQSRPITHLLNKDLQHYSPQHRNSCHHLFVYPIFPQSVQASNIITRILPRPYHTYLNSEQKCGLFYRQVLFNSNITIRDSFTSPFSMRFLSFLKKESV